MTGSVSWGIFAGMITFEDSPSPTLILGPLSSYTQYAPHHHASRVQTHSTISYNQIWRTSWLPRYHVGASSSPAPLTLLPWVLRRESP